MLLYRFLADHHSCRMHRTVPRQSLQSLRHIDQMRHRLIRLIKLTKLRIHLQSFINRNSKLLGNHLGNRIHIGIRQIHDSSYITDDTSCRKRSKCNDLSHAVFSVFSRYIIDHFLPSLIAEIHINIRHGYTFRIQKTLEQELIMDGINGCDPQTIGHDTSRC